MLAIGLMGVKVSQKHAEVVNTDVSESLKSFRVQVSDQHAILICCNCSCNYGSSYLCVLLPNESRVP